ncbi:ATP-NAD kinase [Plectosphaerella plurivora]|uniref:ATP-NAD kinase n=1 Tax=Plectosphaerella plurivora TaxID=936078 RepID=A0A9P9A882_9PEZI|nr:ATP-NAD kinase [Plectosphaerella plurivora]
MGSKDDRHGKHIAYEDDSDSDGSSGGRQPVEVTFDPSSPYRRKSSLVASEAKRMTPISKSKSKTLKTECIVHQFLESQRRSHDALASISDHDEVDASTDSGIQVDADTQQARELYESHPKLDHRNSEVVQAQDDNLEAALEQQVEPKGRRASRADILGVGTGTPDEVKCGQLDEESWKSEITKTASELDMSRLSMTPPEKDEMHSRLLTKKELSEMAWGVRELSRRLSSMRIRFRVKSIFILTKIHDTDLITSTRQIVRWLLGPEQSTRYNVYLEDRFRDNKKFNAAGLIDELHDDFVKASSTTDAESTDAISSRLRYWDNHMCRTRPHTFDFVITLGGDGTVLYASWLFQRVVPPVLSFALGSLGFLTKFDFDDYKSILSGAFNKGVTVSLRLRFEGTIMRSQKRIASSDEASSSTSSQDEDGKRKDLVEELIGEERDDEHTHKPDGTFEILNEIVVDRGPNPTLSYVEIFGDDEHFTSVQADGICVSTPTGSTAYNLAAGGSLCHPENPVMLVTAICAHTLSFRPIILPDTIVLRVGVPYQARTSSWASFDGRERHELFPGDYVTISASRYPFATVQAQGRRSEDWVNSISGKLGWNTRQKQKGYTEWE